MENSSQMFILSAYDEIGNVKYFYFSLIAVLYLSILFVNALLIGVISIDRELHEPMYMFLCNMFVNELYGSTALYPALLVNMLSDTHYISRNFCILQIFCLHTYGSIQFSILAVMAYDRYVSICFPLDYHRIMTHQKVCTLIIFIWLFSFGKFSITLALSMRLKLCGNIINKTACDNYSIVKLSCEDRTVNNIYGYFSIILSVILPVVLIFYSYGEILLICLKSSKDTQIKALNTCTPHLASLTNFAVASTFELLQHRFDMTHAPKVLRVILSLYFMMICPIFNPFIYGIKTKKIKSALKKRFSE